MALSTKNIPQKSRLPLTLQPGTVLAKINSITLEAGKGKLSDGYFLVLNLEGPELGNGFEGFLIDKDDESKGRYKGQTGKVKVGSISKNNSIFPYRSSTVGSTDIDRDQEILKQIASLANELGKSAEINAIEANTIEEYIPKASAVLSGNEEEDYLYFTLGADTYMKNNYPAYALHLVKSDYKAKKFAFSKNSDSVVPFVAEEHI